MAAPTFVDWDDNPNAGIGASVSSLAFSWTDFVGEADDDVVYAAIYRETTAAYTATPANWAQAAGFPQSQDTGGFKYQADLWWRRRSGDTGTATWSWTGAAWAYLLAPGYRGCITTETPFSASWDKETAQNDEPVHPGITIARSNSGLLWFVWNFASSATTAVPTGFTDRNGTAGEIQIYDDLSTSPGASGTVTGDLVNPEYAGSALLEIFTEAAAGGGVTVRPLTALGVGN